MTHMIAVRFPETILAILERIMYTTQKESVPIHIRGGHEEQLPRIKTLQAANKKNSTSSSHHHHHNLINNNFSAMKLFDRFRKIVMRFIFPVNGSGGRSAGSQSTPRHHAPRRRSCDRPETPKTSCSYYYSSNSHYNEAIADCIEFLNKSSQEGMVNTVMRSDAMV